MKGLSADEERNLLLTRKFLSDNGINENSEGSLFIRGVQKLGKEEIDDIFENGVGLFENCSMLAKIAHLDEKKSYTQQINSYTARGNYKILVYIPEMIGSLYLGKADKEYGDASNQYKKHHLFDFMDLKKIPAQFVVGVVHENNRENEFIANPNYFIKSKDTTAVENIIKKASENALVARVMLQTGNTVTELQKSEDEYQRLARAMEGYSILDAAKTIHEGKLLYLKKHKGFVPKEKSDDIEL